MFVRQSGAEYYHSVIDDILLMVSQMIALHIILDIFEEKNRRKWYAYFMPSTQDDHIVNSEIMEERTRVEEHIKCKNM